MDDKAQKSSAVAEELRSFLDGDPPEEIVHQFFADRVFRIGHGNLSASEEFIAGTLSKFPVAPDRIPDFCCAGLHVKVSQSYSLVSFVELKRPNSPLYTGRRLMSKDLNDAWIECIETSRLITDNYRDFIRRLVKALDEQRLREFDKAYEIVKREGGKPENLHPYDVYDTFMPRFSSVIVIGRRASLDSEGLLRTRELSASTNHAIRVITYDGVLDWLQAGKDEYIDGWRMFIPGWIW